MLYSFAYGCRTCGVLIVLVIFGDLQWLLLLLGAKGPVFGNQAV